MRYSEGRESLDRPYGDALLENPGAYERMRREVVRLVAWLLLIVAVLIGVIALGRWCWLQLASDERYRISLAEVECPTPPGKTQQAFLEEIGFYAAPTGLPTTFAIADEKAREQLRSAFANHPWVLSVDEIETKPPSTLRVKLTFRRPVLAVPWEGKLRVVDDRGVLLPQDADAAGLPVFNGRPPRPIDAGKPWLDPETVRQATKANRVP